MRGHIVIQSSSPHASVNRQRLLLSGKSSSPPLSVAPRAKANVGEVAGGTAAECAAICCCCPYTVMQCVILAVYKVPTGICRKVWRKQQQKKLMKKQGLLGHHHRHLQGSSVGGAPIVPVSDESSDVDYTEFEMIKVSIDGSAEVIELDKDMWEHFHNAGFWRSPSQRKVL
ncbi:hypothetical protein Ancab_007454 [Ancistrocladus abbreviatus]